jgi:hypothetical protein
LGIRNRLFGCILDRRIHGRLLHGAFHVGVAVMLEVAFEVGILVGAIAGINPFMRWITKK